MVENKQDQPPAAGVSRHGKVLRDLKPDLIRIGTGAALALGLRSGSDLGDRGRDGRWSETAFRPDEGADQIIEALSRKPQLHVADIFSAAANDNFSFVVGEARRLYLRDSYRHSLPSPPRTIRASRSQTTRCSPYL